MRRTPMALPYRERDLQPVAPAHHDGTCSIFKRQLDITQIKPRLYLGAVADVEKHVSENHPNQKVVVINAGAKSFAAPLGWVEAYSSISPPRDVETDDINARVKITIQLFETANGTIIYNLAMDDRDDVRVNRIFDEIAELIKLNVDNNTPVYVVCHAGISRSPTLLSAYLLKYCQSDLAVRKGIFECTNGIDLGIQNPISYLKQFRKIVYPNLGFCLQLMQYTREVSPGFVDYVSLESPSIGAPVCSTLYVPAESCAVDCDSAGFKQDRCPSPAP